MANHEVATDTPGHGSCTRPCAHWGALLLDADGVVGVGAGNDWS